MAYEDLRHLLKHKRRYAPESLTAGERHARARAGRPESGWLATGKRVYYWITRHVVDFADREGGGLRLMNDAPALTAWLKRHPAVRDAAIDVAFPDRRSGAGLYAFIESDAADASLLRDLSTTAVPARMPERLQGDEAQLHAATSADALRTDILQLIAMNQIDLIDPLIATEQSEEVVASSLTGVTCATAMRCERGLG